MGEVWIKVIYTSSGSWQALDYILVISTGADSLLDHLTVGSWAEVNSNSDRDFSIASSMARALFL